MHRYDARNRKCVDAHGECIELVKGLSDRLSYLQYENCLRLYFTGPNTEFSSQNTFEQITVKLYLQICILLCMQ